MDGRMLARIGAVVFVAFALTATAIEMTREEEGPAAVPAVAATDDPGHLPTELTRCQQLGEAATSDQACLRAWADNRRRFLGLDAPGAGRSSDVSAVPVTEAR
ncbi:putative entry exclusion protein TrbK-alt [Inquilinus sp. CAU 1745]|uniref:putative entry exclusion protein TrbK-alt n=1 Tax=Inquilinus sp. CAU 1745 TaxID=3140369 RepID=UPI00325A468F